MSAENNPSSNTGEIWTDKLGHVFTRTQGESCLDRGLWSGSKLLKLPPFTLSLNWKK